MNILLPTLLLVYAINKIGCETYTNKYDGVDLDEVLQNERLLTGYVKCLLDAGPCSPDGQELKRNLPDAIQNNCSKCTDKQRDGADKVMHYIIDNRPDDWEKLEEKYDSDGTYKIKYLASKGANIRGETKENKSQSDYEDDDDDEDENNKDNYTKTDTTN